MESVFKLPLAIAVMDRVDAGVDTLDAPVTFGPIDFRSGPPDSIADLMPEGGTKSVGELVDTMLRTSDNTAADLLLARVGGGAGVMKSLAARQLGGIDVSRSEGELMLVKHGLPYTRENAERRTAERLIEAQPVEVSRKAMAAKRADPRDKATPDAFVDLLVKLHAGKLLSPASTAFVLGSMQRAMTGPNRLRAGLPPGTVLAHRTGTGESLDGQREAMGDVGIITRPDGTHVAIATFVSPVREGDAKAEAAMAAAARAALDL